MISSSSTSSNMGRSGGIIASDTFRTMSKGDLELHVMLLIYVYFLSRSVRS